MNVPLSSYGRRAFTLLELMIAIALVAAIAALLFSVSGTLRARSDATACLSNLRSVGSMLMAYTADHRGMFPPAYSENDSSFIIRDSEGRAAKGWTRRLAVGGYAVDAKAFLCPSYFPRHLSELRRNPLEVDAAESYGLRSWTLPGAPSYNVEDTRTHKPLAAIETPSDFFLLADSFWAAANWRSQGYSISAARTQRSNNRVHLRHDGKAHAFFADGHIEAKDGDYFLNLHEADRQPSYIGGRRGGLYYFAVESDPPESLTQH